MYYRIFALNNTDKVELLFIIIITTSIYMIYIYIIAYRSTDTRRRYYSNQMDILISKHFTYNSRLLKKNRAALVNEEEGYDLKNMLLRQSFR